MLAFEIEYRLIRSCRTVSSQGTMYSNPRVVYNLLELTRERRRFHDMYFIYTLYRRDINHRIAVVLLNNYLISLLDAPRPWHLKSNVIWTFSLGDWGRRPRWYILHRKAPLPVAPTPSLQGNLHVLLVSWKRSSCWCTLTRTGRDWAAIQFPPSIETSSFRRRRTLPAVAWILKVHDAWPNSSASTNLIPKEWSDESSCLSTCSQGPRTEGQSLSSGCMRRWCSVSWHAWLLR
jgi:hypothetical protein